MRFSPEEKLQKILHLTDTVRKGFPSRQSVIFGILLPAGIYLLAMSAVNNRPAPHQPSELRSGSEYVVTVFTSSTCAAARTKGFAGDVAALKDSLAEAFRKHHLHLKTIGVTLDWDANMGLKALSEYGSFDELHTGGNWANGEVISQIWEKKNGPPSIPQILIVKRTVRVTKAGVQAADSVIRSLVGVPSIRNFLHNKEYMKLVRA